MSDRYGLGIEDPDGYSPLSQLGGRFMGDSPDVEAVATREAQVARDPFEIAAERVRNRERPPGGRQEGWATEHPDLGFIPRSPLDFAMLALSGPFRPAVKISALALGGLLDSDEAQAGKFSALTKGFRGFHGSKADFPAVATVRFKDTARRPIDIPFGQAPHPDLVRAIEAGEATVKEHPLGRFDLEKVGTGSGNQFFSYGHNFAEYPKLAEHYRNKVANAGFTVGDVKYAKDVLDKAKGDVERAIADIEQRRGAYSNPEMQDRLDRIRFVLVNNIERHPGHTYEVAINAHPDQFPDWYKSLSQQHEGVQPILRGVWDKLPESLRGGIADPTAKQIIEGLGQHLGSARSASEELNGLGIPGVKHRAGRGNNYVVYDDALIDILKRYGFGGLIAGPAAHKVAQPTLQQNEF